ncbi:hypothetical protein ACFQ3N_09990 [Virgibacillus byunsanensis]|uniref:Uncharacterized protein n=1 Tax=Virgibacillus byunsanensis TaxID=570945 RepID=A0ABW3LK75_9BACI
MTFVISNQCHPFLKSTRIGGVTMLWLYFAIPVLLLVILTLIKDRKNKKNGRSTGIPFNAAKHERDTNTQAQSDMSNLHQNNNQF